MKKIITSFRQTINIRLHKRQELRQKYNQAMNSKDKAFVLSVVREWEREYGDGMPYHRLNKHFENIGGQR